MRVEFTQGFSDVASWLQMKLQHVKRLAQLAVTTCRTLKPNVTSQLFGQRKLSRGGV